MPSVPGFSVPSIVKSEKRNIVIPMVQREPQRSPSREVTKNHLHFGAKRDFSPLRRDRNDTANNSFRQSLESVQRIALLSGIFDDT
jgi:hypothetical protein